MKPKLKIQVVNQLYLEFILLYAIIVFIYALIYFYYNLAFLLLNCLVTFVLACIIYVTFREQKYAKIIGAWFQITVLYNIVAAILSFGWGYGFELWIISSLAVHYFYMIKNTKKRIFFILIQCVLYLFLYFYTYQMPPKFGDEIFKKAIFLLNFTGVFIALFYLHNNLNIVEAVKILNIEKNRKRYEENAKMDFLTKIYNRAKIYEIINKNLTALKEGQIRSLCLILCDVDNFKNINDTFGHLFGDEILKSTAAALKDNFKKHGDIGRWGGEEFIVSIINESEESLKIIIDNARKNIESLKPNNLDITATFGVLWVSEISGDISAEMLVYEVDLAMYQGKTQGKNRVVFKKYEAK